MDSDDVKKQHRELYSPKAGDFAIVEVPEFAFLCVDGQGNPNTADAYRDAVEALYSVSYGVRFTAKRELERVHVVAPLEGLWWADDLSAFTARSKDDWQWTMMIHQPDWISADMVDAAVAAAEKKKELPGLGGLRFERFAEGLCVQTLHVGSYDDEAPVIERMHGFAAAEGFALRGKHHEIYLSDPRKVEAAKLKTVLRQPVSR